MFYFSGLQGHQLGGKIADSIRQLNNSTVYRSQNLDLEIADFEREHCNYTSLKLYDCNAIDR